jgi:hypothetical protein
MASNYDAKINWHRHVRYNNGGSDYETLAISPIEDSLTKDEFISISKWRNSKSLFMTAFVLTVIPAQYAIGQMGAFKLLSGKLRGAVRFGIPLLGVIGIDTTFENGTKERMHAFHMNKINAEYVKPISHKFKF